MLLQKKNQQTSTKIIHPEKNKHTSGIPDTRRRNCTSRSNAPAGSLVRIIDRYRAVSRRGIVEFVVGRDGIVLPGAGAECLREGFAAGGTVGIGVEDGGEGVFAAGFGAAGRGEGVGGGAEEADDGPGVAA